MGRTALHHLDVRKLGNAGECQCQFGVELVFPLLGLVLQAGLESLLELELGMGLGLELGPFLELGLGLAALLGLSLLGMGRSYQSLVSVGRSV